MKESFIIGTLFLDKKVNNEEWIYIDSSVKLLKRNSSNNCNKKLSSEKYYTSNY